MSSRTGRLTLSLLAFATAPWLVAACSSACLPLYCPTGAVDQTTCGCAPGDAGPPPISDATVVARAQ